MKIYEYLPKPENALNENMPVTNVSGPENRVESDTKLPLTKSNS
jgi:hypothetical protein